MKPSPARPGPAGRPFAALTAGALYFAIVFAAGFALGVPRTLVLEPALGRLGAVALELPVMVAVSWLACARLLRRWPLRPSQALRMGAVAFGLLMLAEAGLAGRSLAAHLALYAEPAQLLGLAGQLVFAALPLVQTGRRTRRR